MEKNSHKDFLHSIKDFASLSQDPRFVGLMGYMRKHIPARGSNVQGPENIIRNEGRFNGWFEALDEMDAVLQPPKPRPEGQKEKPAYQPR